MSLKFKPEDFYSSADATSVYAAEKAQRIFDTFWDNLIKNGKVVYLEGQNNTHLWVVQAVDSKATHKAILINIEKLEQCSHPKEKVRLVLGEEVTNTMPDGWKYKTPETWFQCECGAKVQPKEFEVIE